MAEKLLIDLQNASVKYGTKESAVHALQQVSLTLAQGECLGIAGESGCGKSTMAHVLSGLLPTNALTTFEKFTIQGHPVPKIGSRGWRKIRGSLVSMIFQDPIGSLNPFWTIGQQLAETLLFHNIVSSKKKARVLAGDWLSQVQINDVDLVLRQFPHQLSGGMCQRVNLALALCTQPQILIADEPTTALDVTTQKTVLDLISTLSKSSGMGVVLVSHDLGVLSERSDRLSVMYAGQTMESGETSKLMEAPRHPYTQALLKAQPPIKGPLPETLELIKGQPPRLYKKHERCPFLERCSSSIDECQKEIPSIKQLDENLTFCHLESQ